MKNHIAAVLCLFAGAALAHPGPGVPAEHAPWQHIAAMLAIGLWALVMAGVVMGAGARLLKYARRAGRE